MCGFKVNAPSFQMFNLPGLRICEEAEEVKTYLQAGAASFGEALTRGTALTAPTIVVDSHKATTAPPAYTATLVLFSTRSHCDSKALNESMS